jgi:cell division protein FtsL
MKQTLLRVAILLAIVILIALVCIKLLPVILAILVVIGAATVMYFARNTRQAFNPPRYAQPTP